MLIAAATTEAAGRGRSNVFFKHNIFFRAARCPLPVRGCRPTGETHVEPQAGPPAKLADGMSAGLPKLQGLR